MATLGRQQTPTADNFALLLRRLRRLGQPELQEGLNGRNLGRLDTPFNEGRRLRRLASPPGASAMLFRYPKCVPLSQGVEGGSS